MKEVKVLIGIVFMILGSIIFEMNFGNVLSIFGLFLICFGVCLYVLVVDSLEKKKNDCFDFNLKDFF